MGRLPERRNFGAIPLIKKRWPEDFNNSRKLSIAKEHGPAKSGDESSAIMAEREGFEPSIEFPLYTLSKRAPSTTRPSLREGCSQNSMLPLDARSRSFRPLQSRE